LAVRAQDVVRRCAPIVRVRRDEAVTAALLLCTAEVDA
jgi:hypothetical protein